VRSLKKLTFATPKELIDLHWCDTQNDRTFTTGPESKNVRNSPHLIFTWIIP
jgi:hypothetical protein